MKDSITEKIEDMTMDELTAMLDKAEKNRDYIKAYIKYRRKDDLSSYLEAERESIHELHELHEENE